MTRPGIDPFSAAQRNDAFSSTRDSAPRGRAKGFSSFEPVQYATVFACRASQASAIRAPAIARSSLTPPRSSLIWGLVLSSECARRATDITVAAVSLLLDAGPPAALAARGGWWRIERRWHRQGPEYWSNPHLPEPLIVQVNRKERKNECLSRKTLLVYVFATGSIGPRGCLWRLPPRPSGGGEDSHPSVGEVKETVEVRSRKESLPRYGQRDRSGRS